MSKSWDIFRTITEFVRFSDTKAGVVLAFAGGSAALISNRADILHAVILAHWKDLWGVTLYIACFGYLISLAIAVESALRSIWPSLGAGEKRSLIYFKHIAEDYKGDHAAYAEALRALDERAFEAELAHQICVNAGVATRKFELVGSAVKALAAMLACWGAIVFLLLVLGTSPK